MKPAGKALPSKPKDAEAQLTTFIDKFEPEHQTLIRAVRKVLCKRMPAANELVYDNYNFFVIGYSPTERPSDSILSIAAGASGVGLSFYWGSKLPDPHKVLLGSGSQNRFIRVESRETLLRPEIDALIGAAIAQCKVPFTPKGRGKLIIRSISAKQRLRRKAAK